MCVFDLQRVFYNAKDKSAAYPDYKPPELTEPEWIAAIEANPDRLLLTPVVVHGFQGLQEKIKLQQDSVEKCTTAAEV